MFRLAMVIMFMNASILSGQTFTDLNCPEGPFETDIAKISQLTLQELPSPGSQQATNLVIPIEVSRNRTGGIVFLQGGLMNPGLSSWYAFDVARHLFVAVLGSIENPLRPLPKLEKLSVNQFLRNTDAAGYKRCEFVTVLEEASEQVRAFSCLANKLLMTESETLERPLPADMLTKSFSLLFDGKVLDLGGGRKRWEIEGQLERFISEALQQLIWQAYELEGG